MATSTGTLQAQRQLLPHNVQLVLSLLIPKKFLCQLPERRAYNVVPASLDVRRFYTVANTCNHSLKVPGPLSGGTFIQKSQSESQINKKTVPVPV